MFERFTDRARRVVVLTQENARLLGHAQLGTSHLLLGLVEEGESAAAQALSCLPDVKALRERLTPGDQERTAHLEWTPRCQKVLELALREALQLGHSYIAPEHLLLAIIREGEGTAARIIIESGTDLSRVRQRVIEIITNARPVHPQTPFAGRVALVEGEIIGVDFSDRDDHCIVLHIAVPQEYRVRRCNVTIGEHP